MNLAAVPRIPWPSRRIVVASLWFLITVATVTVVVTFISAPRYEKGQIYPPVRFYELKLAAFLFCLFFAGTSFGAAIEALTDRVRFLAIPATFLGPLLLLLLA